jgi:hypothetical protein
MRKIVMDIDVEQSKIKKGDILTVDDKHADKWIRRKIAHNYVEIKSKFTYINTKIKHVHIRDMKDGWIMQVIGDYLAQLNDKDILFTSGKQQDFNADINYYINWTNNEPRLDFLTKTKCDIILFTHFEKEHVNEENAVINWADRYTCMSVHGKQQLINRGIQESKIGIIEGFGVSTGFRKKIAIGWAGRPYPGLERKDANILPNLAKDLDSDIFKFIFYDKKKELNMLLSKMNKVGADVELLSANYDYFLNSIDYYLSPSLMEGGPMDLLNAAYAGIPIISRDIGFFHTINTKEDFMFKDYSELLKFFKAIETNKKQKIKNLAPYTWDTFKRWHIKHFRSILEI